MTMRILVCSQQFQRSRSGIGTYCRILVNGLIQRGHTVAVAAPADELIDAKGVETIPVRRCSLDPSPGGWISLGRSFARILERRSAHFDVALFTDGREAWLSSSPALPLVGAIHDAYALDWIDPRFPRDWYVDRLTRSGYYRLCRIVEGRTYPRFIRLIANSQLVSATISAGYRGAFPETIYYGLTECSETEVETPSGSPSILFVGGNFQRKGLRTLIAAVARLQSTSPRVRLHVVGADRNEPSLRRDAEIYRLGSRIVFHGRLEHRRVVSMMAGATVFAMPSAVEGFGWTYLEAMQRGCPVVASQSSGLAEVFSRHEVLFVDPFDVESLETALRSIADNPEFGAQLGRTGRRAVEKLAASSMVEATEEVLQQAALEFSSRVKETGDRHAA